MRLDCRLYVRQPDAPPGIASSVLARPDGPRMHVLFPMQARVPSEHFHGWYVPYSGPAITVTVEGAFYADGTPVPPGVL